MFNIVKQSSDGVGWNLQTVEKIVTDHPGSRRVDFQLYFMYIFNTNTMFVVSNAI